MTVDQDTEQADDAGQVHGQTPGQPRGVAAAVGRMIGMLLGELFTLLGRGIDRGFVFVESWLVNVKHARYGISVTRILLGITGLGVLATNFRTRLYTYGSGSAWNGEAAQPRSDFPNMWLFSLFHKLALHDVAFTIAYLLLAVLAVIVILGWRTKLFLPIYFVAWVSFIEVNDALTDQGDNIYRITLLLLLFADTAGRWSMDARRRSRPQAQRGRVVSRIWHGGAYMPAWISNTAHNLVLVALTAQVCFVYASGALYKAGGTPWQHGYAIYNPLHTDRFGPWPVLSDLFTAWGPLVVMVSWASIIIQMCFPLMLLRRSTRIIALFGIGGFHVGIAVLMGLPWFSLAMIAIDSIFIRDTTWAKAGRKISHTWRDANHLTAGAKSLTGETRPKTAERPHA